LSVCSRINDARILVSAEFWVGLVKIHRRQHHPVGRQRGGDRLAARSLPPKQQTQAIICSGGSGGPAIVMRIVLTLFAVALLTLSLASRSSQPAAFWIGVSCWCPRTTTAEIEASDQLLAAIKTILVADLVMSLDNVIAVAAAAGGSVLC